jgi:hypothetical protein
VLRAASKLVDWETVVDASFVARIGVDSSAVSAEVGKLDVTVVILPTVPILKSVVGR